MKKVLQKKMTIFGLFLLFFFGGIHVFAFDTFSTDRDRHVSTPTGKGITDENSNQSSESILEQKTFPESDEPIFERGNDGVLKAPPTFDDGETYPPGGQVNPKLPLTGGIAVLLSACFVYMIIRLLRRKKIV